MSAHERLDNTLRTIGSGVAAKLLVDLFEYHDFKARNALSDMRRGNVDAAKHAEKEHDVMLDMAATLGHAMAAEKRDVPALEGDEYHLAMETGIRLGISQLSNDPNAYATFSCNRVEAFAYQTLALSQSETNNVDGSSLEAKIKAMVTVAPELSEMIENLSVLQKWRQVATGPKAKRPERSTRALADLRT
jgi:hypothetical protein